MGMKSINVVVRTLGRNTLYRLLSSLQDLTQNDYITILVNQNLDYVKEIVDSCKFTANINIIDETNSEICCYGYRILNKYINDLDGDYIMFGDDDDRFVDNIFNYIKNVCVDEKLYIFKHKWGSTINWTEKEVVLGNIGQCMCVIPNTKNFPKFTEDVFGDGLFYEEISKNFEVEFIDKIIYLVRDTEL
jgi:hypothetical protein